MAKRNTGRLTTIEIQGLKQAQRIMGRLDADFKKRVKDIHKGAADIMAEEARKQAPRDTGRLKNDIGHSGTANGSGGRGGGKRLR